MPNPYFKFKQFTIRQENTTLKVTTDACLLGAYAHADSPRKILDIGTGTGILALMAAQRYSESHVLGIEPDEEAALQAERNVINSPWENRVSIRNCRLQDFARENRSCFDLILCNPPYYSNQLASSNPRSRLARHSTDLNFQELSNAVDKLTSTKGCFFVILPPAQFDILKGELGIYGFKPFDKLLIYNVPGRPLYRISGGFSRNDLGESKTSLLIRNEKSAYTEAFRELLRDFYLEF